MRGANEYHITVAIARYFREVAPDVLFSHFPAGELRDQRTGAKLKHMGLNPGWPDFLLVLPGGVVGAIEVKAEGGKLSDTQKDFRDRCTALGGRYVVCRSIDDVRQTLAEWQVPTREAA